MGFMDKLRAELVDVIEWVDDGRRTLSGASRATTTRSRTALS